MRYNPILENYLDYFKLNQTALLNFPSVKLNLECNANDYIDTNIFYLFFYNERNGFSRIVSFNFEFALKAHTPIYEYTYKKDYVETYNKDGRRNYFSMTNGDNIIDYQFIGYI